LCRGAALGASARTQRPFTPRVHSASERHPVDEVALLGGRSRLGQAAWAATLEGLHVCTAARLGSALPAPAPDPAAEPAPAPAPVAGSRHAANDVTVRRARTGRARDGAVLDGERMADSIERNAGRRSEEVRPAGARCHVPERRNWTTLAAMTLPTQSFLALAAVGWADGSLQKVEAVGLLRAARDSGLSEADVAAVEAATKTRPNLRELDLAGMSSWEQVLTFALGAWLAQADGVVSTDEHETLRALGDALGLADPLRKRAAVAAYDVACLPEAGRPERFDLAKLEARLRERLPQIGA